MVRVGLAGVLSVPLGVALLVGLLLSSVPAVGSASFGVLSVSISLVGEGSDAMASICLLDADSGVGVSSVFISSSTDALSFPSTFLSEALFGTSLLEWSLLSLFSFDPDSVS